ncbi:hypothetical protein [Pseudonocardia spinosispora]|uniref:hypothetical protein n=1 Tax=Pseudonocardia spinosispora TaxID=103441 RepID=UPI0003F5CD13|nr:hypothetical protein [Pseudonocardia spinosispora]
MTAGGCANDREHASLADELREYAGGALDLLEPLVDRIREQPVDDTTGPEPASCASCPVCALIAVLRGERSELAVRLADQAAGLLAVLRTALQEGVGADVPTPGHREPTATPRPTASTQGQPRVQRIQVSRDGRPTRPLHSVRSSAESC